MLIAKVKLHDLLAGFKHSGKLPERDLGPTDAQSLEIGHLLDVANNMISRQPITVIDTEADDGFWGQVFSEVMVP